MAGVYLALSLFTQRICRAQALAAPRNGHTSAILQKSQLSGPQAHQLLSRTLHILLHPCNTQKLPSLGTEPSTLHTLSLVLPRPPTQNFPYTLLFINKEPYIFS